MIQMDGLNYPWPNSPEPASMRTIIDGLHWAQMPLPFALDHVNVWVLDDASGSTIVDTGIHNDQTRRCWSRLIEQSELRISRLLVTHYHPDHIGLAGWFAEHYGVEVLSSELEWQAAIAAMGMLEDDFVTQQDRWYQLHGLDQSRRTRFVRAGNSYKPLVHQLPSTPSTIEAGSSLVIRDREWRIHTVGGHAIDMICLHNADHNLLIAADHVLPMVSPNISLQFYHGDLDPMANYLGALHRFKDFDPDILVLPSHGLPFRGLHQRIAELERHHESRFELLIDQCKTPSTAVDVLEVLFRRTLGFEQLMFAIGESVAHLHYLASAGELQCYDDGGKRYYHRLN